MQAVQAVRKKFKVMLIDDQPAILRELESLIEGTGIAEVVATSEQGAIGVPLALKLRPDLVTVDVSLPGMNGIEIVYELKLNWPDVRILAISAYPYELYVRSMFTAGVQGYMLKEHAPEELKAAIESVMNGESWISDGLSMPAF